MPEFNDEIWKRSIHTLFRPMIAFHFPNLHPLIDWRREPAFLEEELANLFDPKKEGKRFVDILAQVFLLDGAEKYILLHVEVQGYGSGEDEAKKLFKIALLRLGIERGYTAKELEALFYFVDWVVAFSGVKARNEFVGEVRAMAKKEEILMPYVTSIEEVTREETRIETRIKTRVETRLAVASKMLKAGELDEKILMYSEISPEDLADLKERILRDSR